MEDPTTLNRFVGLCALGFGLMVTYSVARPATESLFLEFPTKGLLVVWPMVGVVTLIVVTIYNRYAASHSLMKLFSAMSFITAGVFGVLLAARPFAPWPVTFLLYIWKDVYIVILVEIFWSYANCVFDIKSARWLYGLFIVSGTLGSVVGNLGVGYVAKDLGMGTMTTLMLVVPAMIIIGAACLLLTDPGPAKAGDEPTGTFTEGFKVVARSRYLLMLLALIGLTQVVITLVDYQYNDLVKVTYTETDERTQIIGLVYSAINLASLVISLLTGPVLRTVGIGASLLVIPFLLGGAVLGAAVVQRFVTMAVAKVASKAFDYSLFRAAKEILYIPLNRHQKTQGKALIDMFMYRFAKGGASLILWVLLAVGPIAVTVAIFMLIAAWVWITGILVRMFKERSGQDDTTDLAGDSAA